MEDYMERTYQPQDQVYWYHHHLPQNQLLNSIEAEVVIVGGGIAGLSAAQAFFERGKKVVLVEQFYCGSGASGKSSGFITPNAELSLTDFAHHYDMAIAKRIWDFITDGVESIRNNITSYQLNCDYSVQDTLVVANSKHALKELEIEHANLVKLGYKSDFYGSSHLLQAHLHSKNYYGGVGYQDTFGIDGFAYCQGMKKILQNKGLVIFEETPVISIEGHTVKTVHGKIVADTIVICADRFIPELGFLKEQIYHAQTFLLISECLTHNQISSLFPNDKLMVWDTDLIYTYFRVTGANRLLLGGGSLLNTYARNEYHNYEKITVQLQSYLRKKFPQLDVSFVQQWPGLIGISKDLVPIAGADRNNSHIYFISAAAGLPIAAALGKYSAEHIIDKRSDLDDYFSPYRSFAIGTMMQKVLGTKLSFAISNGITKYW